MLTSTLVGGGFLSTLARAIAFSYLAFDSIERISIDGSGYIFGSMLSSVEEAEPILVTMEES